MSPPYVDAGVATFALCENGTWICGGQIVFTGLMTMIGRGVRMADDLVEDDGRQ